MARWDIAQNRVRKEGRMRWPSCRCIFVCWLHSRGTRARVWAGTGARGQDRGGSVTGHWYTAISLGQE